MAVEVVVVLVFLALGGLVAGGLQFARRVAQRRVIAFEEGIHSRGWHVTGRDDSYARRWTGGPFGPHGGHAGPVVVGRHRGRDFVAFEYSHTMKPTPHSSTTVTHRFAVWAVPLPAAVPNLSVSPAGMLGGKAARAFDPATVTTGDDEFDQNFTVRCDDPLFASRVLQPSLVELLKSTRPWDWWFEATNMLAFEKGRLEPDRIAPKIDDMTVLLDHIPREAWEYYGYDSK